jgi:hypothetical protein
MMFGKFAGREKNDCWQICRGSKNCENFNFFERKTQTKSIKLESKNRLQQSQSILKQIVGSVYTHTLLIELDFVEQHTLP